MILNLRNQTFVFRHLVRHLVLDLILKCFCLIRSSPRWRVTLLLYVDWWSFHILICWEQFSGICFAVLEVFEDVFLPCFLRLDSRMWRLAWWLACKWEVWFERRDKRIKQTKWSVSSVALVDNHSQIFCFGFLFDVLVEEFDAVSWKLPGAIFNKDFLKL
jgi:hypothetical protein